MAGFQARSREAQATGDCQARLLDSHAGASVPDFLDRFTHGRQQSGTNFPWHTLRLGVLYWCFPDDERA